MNAPRAPWSSNFTRERPAEPGSGWEIPGKGKPAPFRVSRRWVVELDPGAFERAWTEGRAMTLEEAVAYTLLEADAPESPKP